MGRVALFENTTATDNTAVGYGALQDATTGHENTAVGFSCAGNVTTGRSNVAMGREALLTCTTGDYNTAIGYEALRTNSTGDHNVAVGQGAFRDGTGQRNTAIGPTAQRFRTTGDDNVSVGHEAGRGASSASPATGDGNVSVGRGAHEDIRGGSNNTAVGREAHRECSTGSNNTCLGNQAGRSTSPSNTLNDESNTVCIGNNDVSAAFIKVAFQTGSDRRDKTDIEDFNFGLDWVNKMRPVTYRWDNRDWYDGETPDGSKKAPQLELGLIAQEELEIEKEFGFGKTKEDMLISSINSGGSYTMKYERIVPVLINAIKELSAEVQALKAA